jgi:hypothetical protein
VITGEMVTYVIEQGATGWEIGVGAYDATANTLTRRSIKSSVGTATLLPLDGTAAVFLTATSRDLSVPYQAATRTAGDVTAPAGNVFASFDTATDITLPAQPGDVIDARINCQAGDNLTVVTIEFNIALVKDGVETSWFVGNVGSNTPIGAWTIRGGDYFGQSASIGYVVKTADVSADGKITVRLKVRTNGGSNARKIFASAGTVPFLWDARNTGPQRVTV